ncbi:MAG: VIT domain-containing protein [Fibrobacterales bacterium]
MKRSFLTTQFLFQSITVAIIAFGIFLYINPIPVSTAPSVTHSPQAKPILKKVKKSKRVKTPPTIKKKCTNGMLTFIKEGKAEQLPLIHSDVVVTISGLLARVTLKQTFVNSDVNPLEVEYLFPLSEKSAVDSMTMRTPSRLVYGVVKKKEEAEAEYQAALKKGQRASVVHQVRSNIFKQKLGNVMPGDTIEITISYLEEVSYDLHTLRYHFPMTIGPYFTPEAKDSAIRDSISQSVSTPYNTPTHRDPSTISLTLSVEANDAITAFTSPSHRIHTTLPKNGWYTITLSNNDQIPNKDFMLEIPYSNTKPLSQFTFEKGAEESFWHLTLFPPTGTTNKAHPRDLTFIMDRSGSMRGFPLDKSKEVMENLLKNTNPDDRFRIIKFAGTATDMSPVPLPANAQYIQKALTFIDETNSHGGTNVLPAMEKALSYPADAYRERVVIFMSDAYVSNEKQINALVKEKIGTGKVFTIGIGSSVNHSLLRSMAIVGNGHYSYIRHDGDAEKRVKELYQRMEAPVLNQLLLSGDVKKASKIYPKVIPYLGGGQPLQLTGMIPNSKLPPDSTSGLFQKVMHSIAPSNNTLTLTGIMGDSSTWSQGVHLNTPTSRTIGLPALWARKHIEHIEFHEGDYKRKGNLLSKKQDEKVTQLGLKYQIMTRNTSFLAVESITVNSSGNTLNITQPNQHPVGVAQYLKAAPPARIRKNKISPISEQHQGQFLLSKTKNSHSAYSVSRGATISGRKTSSKFTHYAEAASGGMGDALSALLGGGGGAVSLGAKGKFKAPSSSDIVITDSNTLRSKASIMRVIRSRSPGLRHIYNKYLKKHPGFAGILNVSLTIAASGKIISFTLESSSTGVTEFDNEIRNKVKRWKFERIASGECTITVPLAFSE